MILLASPSADTLTTWKRGVGGLAQIFCTDTLDALKQSLEHSKPQILLLDHDLPGVGIPTGIADLIKLNPAIKIVVFSGPLADEAEWEIFKAGVRGCCHKSIDPKLLNSVVTAVLQGELWMRRTLTCRLLDELGKIALDQSNAKQATSDLLASLTPREHEIAALIGNGESNKQIALRLAITERTVKAHLTEIFRKLEVSDRLKLALIVTGSLNTLDQT